MYAENEQTLRHISTHTETKKRRKEKKKKHTCQDSNLRRLVSHTKTPTVDKSV